MLQSVAQEDDVRLPKTVQPILYDILLEPDLKNFVFQGKETIDIKVLESTPKIEIHAKELEAPYAEFIKDGKKITPISIDFDAERERVIFLFEQTLPLGLAKLAIHFKGILNDQNAGFYRSIYEVSGEKRIMASTQFEATDARRAFPCWDEPAIKARFRIRMKIQKHLGAFSNMPIDYEMYDHDTGKKIVSFEITPVMSTYPLAFVVGEFEYIEGKTKGGVPMRIITTPGKKELGRFALDAGIKFLDFYEDLFGVAYPLPKLDMIAIPDFEAGAMENWGLVTYRERSLLVDPEHSSLQIRQRVAVTVAHELAHMQFGDLVTMAWWDGLSLNEGFATAMEYFAVDAVFPEWNLFEQFTAIDFCSALEEDALRSTHPIEVQVKHPSEIGQIFDRITYGKGAVVVMMIVSYLGKDDFRKGMRLYLTRHAYGNATVEDLWQALEEVSGKPVRAIMDTWMKEPGYPMLTITPKDNDTYEITQRRFLSGGETLLPEEEKQEWVISLPYKTDKTHEEKFTVIRSKTHRIDAGPHSWIKINAGQQAFLRVLYQPDMRKALLRAVKESKLETKDRIGIINDMHAFMNAGMMSGTEFLETLEAFREETEFTVWNQIAQSVYEIRSLFLEDDPAATDFNTFIKHIFGPIVAKKGWEEDPNETHAEKLLRPMVLDVHGAHDDEHTIREAQERFARALAGKEKLNPTLRQTVYRICARHGTKETFDTLLDLYRNAKNQEEQVYILTSLGNFRDKTILKHASDFSLTSDVRAGNLMFFFRGANVNPWAREHMWNFVQEQWDELSTRYKGNWFSLSGILEDVLGVFHSHGKANEIEQFFKEHPIRNAERAITKSLERIRSRAKWRARDYDAITQWLKSWNKTSQRSNIK